MLLPSLPFCIIDPPFIILIYNDLLTHLQLLVKNEDLTPALKSEKNDGSGMELEVASISSAGVLDNRGAGPG